MREVRLSKSERNAFIGINSDRLVTSLIADNFYILGLCKLEQPEKGYINTVTYSSKDLSGILYEDSEISIGQKRPTEREKWIRSNRR